MTGPKPQTFLNLELMTRILDISVTAGGQSQRFGRLAGNIRVPHLRHSATDQRCIRGRPSC